MTVHKIPIAGNLVPMSFSRFCGLAARATAGILKTVEVVTCQNDHATLIKASPGQSRTKFDLLRRKIRQKPLVKNQVYNNMQPS